MNPLVDRFRQELRQAAERRFGDALAASLRGESLFPLVIRFGKPDAARTWAENAARVAAVDAESKTTRESAGYTVIWVDHRFGTQGNQRIYDTLSFATPEDFHGYLGRTKDWRQAHRVADAIVARFPHLGTWPADNLRRVLEISESDWGHALTLAGYLAEHPFPGRLPRELPIPIPTKFCERRESLLKAFLPAAIPHACLPGDTLAERLGFATPAPLIAGRVSPDLTSPDRPELRLALTAADWRRRFATPIDTLVIVENQTTFLTFPLPPNSAVFFGRGFAVSQLAELATIPACRRLYWGDLDAHGFSILAQLRRQVPAIESFLMSADLLDEFAEFVQADAPDDRTDSDKIADHLSPDELALRHRIHTGHLRLEQEHIPIEYQRRVVALIGSP